MGIAAPHHTRELVAPAAPTLSLRAGRADDTAAIYAHFLRLTPEDRAMRFCGTISDLSLERHAAKIGTGRPRALLAVAADPETGKEEIHGMVELFPDGDHAELAISLERPWRGQGVAESLMRAAAAWCVRKGIARITAMTLSHNHRMKGLGRKLGARIRSSPDGVDLIFDAAALAARRGPAAERAGGGGREGLLNARRLLSPASLARMAHLPALRARLRPPRSAPPGAPAAG